MADLKISEFTDGGDVQVGDQLAAARTGSNVRVQVGSAAALDAGADVGELPILEDVGGGVAGLPAIDGSQLLNLPGGSAGFNDITSGTNTAATMVVGNGASISPTGTGTITANQVVAANETSDTTCFILFGTSATGNVSPKTNALLTFDSSTGAFGVGTTTVTSTSATALAVGPNGAINPTFAVDTSAATAANGIKISGSAAGNGVSIDTISSASFENLSLKPKASGFEVRLSGTTTSILFILGFALRYTMDGSKLSCNDAAVVCKRIVEANTDVSASPNVLTVNESRTLYTNEGATAKNYHTLPSAAAGLEYEFYVQDSDGMRITASAGDTIRVQATVSAVAGYTESTTVGNSIKLVAINATEWVAIAVNGTWTVT